MNLLTFALFGFAIAFLGSIVPSFLNLTVVKMSLKNGRKSALYLVAGFATILLIQANVGAYLSSILMKNSEYITGIQKIGTIILIALSINFFRLHFAKKQSKRKKEIESSKAYLHGIVMSLLNTFAIPFYFTTISLLIGLNYFEYSLLNSFVFSIGSTIGSFSMYAIYATVASNIEHKLSYIATKMNFIIGCLTGLVGLGNIFYLISS